MDTSPSSEPKTKLRLAYERALALYGPDSASAMALKQQLDAEELGPSAQAVYLAGRFMAPARELPPLPDDRFARSEPIDLASLPPEERKKIEELRAKLATLPGAPPPK